MENVSLSLHSIERLNERYNIYRIDVCKSVAERAWRNGKTVDRFPKRMRKFLSEIKYNVCEPTIVKIHAKNCYIFTDMGKLITVYSIAEKYDDYMNTLKPYEFDNYYA